MESERKSRYELFLEEEARKAQPTKRCSKCGEEKSLSEFWKNNGQRSGLMPRCKKCSKKSKFGSVEDRFWKTYQAKTVRVGDCIEWTGGCSGGGRSGRPACMWEGKRTSVRRIVYKLSIGDLPDGMVVTTTCKNILCLRQSHLKKVSAEEMKMITCNSAASGDKTGSRLYPERVARGERSGHAKFTDEIVRAMRDMHAQGGVSYKEVSRRFGVPYDTAWLAIHRKTWKHVE